MYDAVDPGLYDLPVDPQDPASPTYGEIADGSLARQTEIIDFLASQFGPYPFSSGGGIVDDADNLFFALETRPARSTRRTSSPTQSASTSWWSTRMPTSGTATAWPWPSGTHVAQRGLGAAGWNRCERERRRSNASVAARASAAGCSVRSGLSGLAGTIRSCWSARRSATSSSLPLCSARRWPTTPALPAGRGTGGLRYAARPTAGGARP
jgi:hypothetical protein